MHSLNRKQLWDRFYSEVIGNILTTGIYNDHQSLSFPHNASAFHTWISTMKNRFETENVEVLEEYTNSILTYK